MTRKRSLNSVIVTAALTVVAVANIDAAENAAPPVLGKLVTRPGEPRIAYLAFRDQKAAELGKVTHPLQVKVADDGTFTFPDPETLPEGYTIATTPPCVALASLVAEVNVSAIGPTPGKDPLAALGTSVTTQKGDFKVGKMSVDLTRTEKFTGTDQGLKFLLFGKFGFEVVNRVGGINVGCGNGTAKVAQPSVKPGEVAK